MPFTIQEATVEDAAAIAKIWMSNDDDFLRLQLGTASPSTLGQDLTRRLAQSIHSAREVYVTARDDESQEVVSYSSWTLPRKENEPVAEQSLEDKNDATEVYHQNLLPGMNAALVMDFREAIGDMQERVIKGRRAYMLGNIGTLPWYRRRGTASALTCWPFDRADADGVLVYLDTDERGPARRMYERLGFKEADVAVFHLDKYGGAGIHRHIAMVREPQPPTVVDQRDLSR